MTILALPTPNTAWFESIDGEVSAPASPPSPSRDWWIGASFPIEIPKGATIISATVSVRMWTKSDPDVIRVLSGFAKYADSFPMSSTAYDLSSRTVTSPHNYTNYPVDSDETYRPFDCTDSLQALVKETPWVPGGTGVCILEFPFVNVDTTQDLNVAGKLIKLRVEYLSGTTISQSGTTISQYETTGWVGYPLKVYDGTEWIYAKLNYSDGSGWAGVY